MEKENFEKIKIHFDESNYYHKTHSLKNKLKLYQKAVDLYNSLGINQIIEDGELFLLLDNPKEFIATKMINGDSLEVGNQKIKPEKLFDMIEKPEEYETVIKNISDLIKSNNDKYSTLFPSKQYTVIGGNKVEIKKEVLNLIKEQSSTYITNKDQLKVYNLLNGVISSLNEIKKINKGIINDDFLKNYLKNRLSEHDDFSLNTKVIEQF